MHGKKPTGAQLPQTPPSLAGGPSIAGTIACGGVLHGRWLRYAGLFLLLLLAGCYLVSGERISDLPLTGEEEAEYSAQFVSADGTDERELLIGQADVPILLQVSVDVEWGELVVECLEADGSVALTMEARYGRSTRGEILVRSDAAGLVRYRLRANEASNGAYTIRYRIQIGPTPTPSPSPSPSPTPQP